MKKLLFVLALCIGWSVSHSQTPEEMKAWQESMKPAAPHLMLAKMEGTWNADVTMWMDPSQPAEKMKATETNEIIMNGLFIRSKFNGEMMGMPFTGESVIGFDNIKKKFVSTWIDNMSSGIVYMEGTFDQKTKTLTMDGKMSDAMTGKEVHLRQKMVYGDKDNHTFTMYTVNGDTEVKTMEIKYSKAK